MGSEGKVIKHLLVDLDGTLYRSAKLFSDVRDNIEEYLKTHLGVKAEDAREEGARLYREYGLTIAGLLVCSVCLAGWLSTW
jgi:FMN phosphatase YigB (HAD superfamily)